MMMTPEPRDKKIASPQAPGETSVAERAFAPGRPYYGGESYVPLTEGSGLMHADYQTALRSAGLDTLAGVFAYEAGQRLEKPGLGTRQRIRLELDVQGRPAGLYLKRFGRPSWRMWWERLIKLRANSPTAMSDFQSAQRLAQAGVAVPRPVAVGEQRRGLREKRSFVMLEELPDADALERLLPRWDEAAQTYILLRDRKNLVIEAADLVRRLHGAGYVHRDLYLSHLFVSRDETGAERLVLIDLQRVFRPDLRKRRWVVKDLAQLYYSSLALVTRTQMLRFARHYFGGDKLTSAQKSLCRAVVRKARRMARRLERRRTT